MLSSVFLIQCYRLIVYIRHKMSLITVQNFQHATELHAYFCHEESESFTLFIILVHTLVLLLYLILCFVLLFLKNESIWDLGVFL